MTYALHTGPNPDQAYEYLILARKHYTQKEIAQRLGVSDRAVRRWEIRQTPVKPYLIPALQQLLPFAYPEKPQGLFNFVDLFAGIGGIRLAFEGIGGRCVFTSEWDAYAQKTYAENFRDGHPIAGDITQISAEDIPDHALLLAGFPRQPFSIAGVSKKNALGLAHGFACETQGTLFFDVARIIETKRPRAFVLENVKNLISHDKGRTFQVIRRTLSEELGYHIHWRVLDGAHFTPQHRERILIVGFREPVAFDFDALPLPPKNARKLSSILHHADGQEPELPWDGGRYFDAALARVNPKYTLTDKLWQYLLAYADKHRAKGNGFGYGLVGPNDVARTLSARYYKDGSEILIDQGPGKNPRRLTPRECARLMGFPDTFRIPVSDTRAYKLFADAAVVPMLEEAAKLIISAIQEHKPDKVNNIAITEDTMVKSNRWTKEQLKLAFHLYCQLPFGRLHYRNPEINQLANLIGRTPSAVAMKLVNFASLDPAITSTGRKGLGNASDLDREIWNEFNADWEKLAIECYYLRESLISKEKEPTIDDSPEYDLNYFSLSDYTGETKKVITEQRIKQSFFRRAVLSSYQGHCCMSGLSEPKLLVASHIVPWRKDKGNRLNPRNGLCLSALHDKAFDLGFITLTDDMKILVSETLHRRDDNFINQVLLPLNGQAIRLPERFRPEQEFIKRHRQEIFLDNQEGN